MEAGDEGVDGAGEGEEGGEDVGYAGVGARAEDDETFTFDVYHDVSFIHNHSIGKPPFLPRTLILLPPHPSQHPLS